MSSSSPSFPILCAALLGGLGVVSRPGSSAAQSTPGVAVSLQACDGLLTDQLDHFLDVELGVRRVDPASERRATHIVVRCSGQQVTLTAHFVDGDTAARDLDRFEVEGRVGARLLALAIAELARRAPGAVTPSDTQQPQPTSQAREDPTRTERDLLLFASASLSSFDFAGAPFLGGVAGIRSFAMSPVAMQLDLGISQSSRDFDLGSVTTGLLAVTPRLGVGERFAWGSLAAAAGYRLGLAHIAGSAGGGTAANQGSITGIVSGPVISGHGALQIAESLLVVLDTELGYVVTPLTGEVVGSSGVQLDGFWLGVSLGLGFEL